MSDNIMLLVPTDKAIVYNVRSLTRLVGRFMWYEFIQSCISARFLHCGTAKHLNAERCCRLAAALIIGRFAGLGKRIDENDTLFDLRYSFEGSY